MTNRAAQPDDVEDYSKLPPDTQVRVFKSWKRAVGYSSLGLNEQRRLLAAHMGLPINKAVPLMGKIRTYAELHKMGWPQYYAPDAPTSPDTPEKVTSENQDAAKDEPRMGAHIAHLKTRIAELEERAELIPQLQQALAQTQQALTLLLAQPHNVYASATLPHQLATLSAWADNLPADTQVTAQAVATHMGLPLDAAKDRYMQLQTLAS
jgi:hypothetical protein